MKGSKENGGKRCLAQRKHLSRVGLPQSRPKREEKIVECRQKGGSLDMEVTGKVKSSRE